MVKECLIILNHSNHLLITSNYAGTYHLVNNYNIEVSCVAKLTKMHKIISLFLPCFLRLLWKYFIFFAFFTVIFYNLYL